MQAIQNGNAIAAIYFAGLDEENARKWHEKVGQLGLLYGIYALGVYVASDNNETKALEYYHQASSLGSGPSYNKLGDLYREGAGGVSLDYKRAFDYYQ